MNKIWKLFENDIGIDLGTANVRVWVKGEGLVLDEPTVVTVDASTRKILAVGEEAAIGAGGSREFKSHHTVTARSKS